MLVVYMRGSAFLSLIRLLSTKSTPLALSQQEVQQAAAIAPSILIRSSKLKRRGCSSQGRWITLTMWWIFSPSFFEGCLPSISTAFYGTLVVARYLSKFQTRLWSQEVCCKVMAEAPRRAVSRSASCSCSCRSGLRLACNSDIFHKTDLNRA